MNSKLLLAVTLLTGSVIDMDAATLTVTNTGNSGAGSLRQCITEAASGDCIRFAVQGTIRLTSGPVVVMKDTRIVGPGADKLFLDGRSFEIGSRGSRNLSVFISDLSIINGVALNTLPGDHGGGIQNFAALTLERCAFTNNMADWMASGGAIWSDGTLIVRHCTFSQNATANWGGAIYAESLVMDSCTVYDNVANNGWGGGICCNKGFITNSTISCNEAWSGNGGGIAIWESGILQSCTICSNRLWSWASWNGKGAGVWTPSNIFCQGSIIAENTNVVFFIQEFPDFYGTISGGGFNLIQNTKGCIVSDGIVGNIFGLSPKLGPLTDNGGPTFTHALLPGSPAIDAGNAEGLAADQRGFPRNFNVPSTPDESDGTDIGAFETSPGLYLDRRPGYLKMHFFGPANRTNEVEATDNLSAPNWRQIATPGTDESGHFSIEEPTALPSRFFRIKTE